ncbi:methyltransferase [Orbus sturtevantii]|uniref:tRNA1(Val) (adenine(37)-N6)-methyltransferase n=1 Tax=Orbus sturtevantii TaxID=3074109 RepID=UPI00370D0346
MTELRKNGFTFKRFFIAHDNSPMKVTTDSCLLGAWSPITASTKKVLDIGCGCGIISLMLAQRLEHCDSHIDAIDIDANAVVQCQDNIVNSPFNNITAKCIDINRYQLTNPSYYDLIVTNPPYFEPAVDCRNHQRQQARYTENLNHTQLITAAKRLLTITGRFCVVLPYHLSHAFIELCLSHNWYLAQQMQIQYTDNKPISLSLLCFSLQAVELPVLQSLTMRDNENRYSRDFRQLLNDFYLFQK